MIFFGEPAADIADLLGEPAADIIFGVPVGVRRGVR